MAAHSRPLLVFALAVYVGVVVMLVSSIVFKGSTATALGLRATRQLDHDTDHLIHNLSCAEIPNFCGDSVGQIVCAHFCYLGVDHLIHNLSCAKIPNFCGDSIGVLVCEHFCKAIGKREVPRLTEDLQYETSEVVDTGERYATLNEDEPSESCQDNVGGNLHCALLTDVCTNPYASLLCPRFCGFCTSEQKSTAESPDEAQSGAGASSRYRDPEPCEDHVGKGLTCSQLYTDHRMCSQRPHSKLICCATCRSHRIKHEKADWVCADMVGTLFKTKEELCADTMGEEACAEFCR